MANNAIRHALLLASMLVALLFAHTARAYEAELRAAAAKLVLQLENAGQKSGTVLDFTDLQGQGTELGRFLAQELSDQLVTAASAISFVDRANLQHLLRENKLSMEGLVSPETSRKLGNVIGIDTVIFGTVTPIGKSVRLSIRAVAVETGKIVASQSATVPMIGELSELYTRGVNGTSTAQSGTSPSASASNVRDRLRADSFKLVPLELVASKQGYDSHVSFSIENRSGMGVGIAVRANATSVGACKAVDDVRGLAVIDDQGIQQVFKAPEPTRLLRWLPHGGKVSVSIGLLPRCSQMVEGVAAVPLTVNVVVAAGKDVVVLPLNVDKVPVRLVGNR